MVRLVVVTEVIGLYTPNWWGMKRLVIFYFGTGFVMKMI